MVKNLEQNNYLKAMRENILSHIDDKYFEYKGFDLVKDLIIQYPDFAVSLNNALENKKAKFWGDDVFDIFRKQRQLTKHSVEEHFIYGKNIGACTTMSRQLAYSLPEAIIEGGIVEILRNTFNSEEGSHTWVLSNGLIYDSTLMLVFDESLKQQFSYITENFIIRISLS